MSSYGRPACALVPTNTTQRPGPSLQGNGDSMGRTTTPTTEQATRALRLLNAPEMRHHPTTGPRERRTPSTTPSAPLNIDLVDHLTATADELVTLTRDIDPDAGLPPQLEALYDWCIQHTGTATADQQAYRDLVIERQRLEHAIRLGEHDVVCREPCPRCGCWGLMWDTAAKRARCTNRRCRTPEGMTSTWSLARLAAQKIHRTEVWRRTAT